MITFPNCKINLGLRVVGKRPDGYHDLDSVFYPLPFFDALEIVPDQTHSLTSTGTTFTSSGLTISGPIEDNLCLKAYAVLKKDFPSIPFVRIHLHKAIPMGAGLGGGSADAAFTLRILDELFQLKLTGEQMRSYALQLGSDCPFFLVNKPCYTQGRGELLEAIQLDLSAYSFLLVNPGIHVSTAAAFAGIKPSQPPFAAKEIAQGPLINWKEKLLNDFEAPVFLQYPEIANIKDQLYTAGAIYASMSGTGSTVYGLFEKDHVPAIEWPSHYFTKILAG